VSLFDEIRSAAREVARRARFVRIDFDALGEFAKSLGPELSAVDCDDPAHMRLSDDRETLAYVLTVDAVNFGSGWFPVLRKLEGRSGYFTIATALRRHFEANGSWSAAALARIRPVDCTRVFLQDPANTETEELMALFARSLRDLGQYTLDHSGASFEGLVERADGRAERLVGMLAEMPLYRDVARYEELEVPLYKRAQITAADLAVVFEQEGPGRFADIDELTMFPDNLVPHVLRCEGVLDYEAGLAARIDAAELLAPGSPEEVEIRAVGLHAVECIAAQLRQIGADPVTARDLDRVLWSRGQSPVIKSRNRHRARSVYY
jgi:hypothetical protein